MKIISSYKVNIILWEHVHSTLKSRLEALGLYNFVRGFEGQTL